MILIDSLFRKVAISDVSQSPFPSISQMLGMLLPSLSLDPRIQYSALVRTTAAPTSFFLKQDRSSNPA